VIEFDRWTRQRERERSGGATKSARARPAGAADRHGRCHHHRLRFRGVPKDRVVWEREDNYLELLDQVPGVGRADEDVALGRLDEAVVHGLVDERQQQVVVPVHVKQSHLQQSSPAGLCVVVRLTV
jgi:hypothetical protein